MREDKKIRHKTTSRPKPNKNGLRTRPKKPVLFNVNSVMNTRERQQIRVVEEADITDREQQIPQCSHGPCLLFADSSNNRWYGCAVFRSPKLCRFRIKKNADGRTEPFNKPQLIQQTRPIEDYGYSYKSFINLQQLGVDAYWCSCCSDYVSNQHEHWPFKGPFSEWVCPLQLIETIQQDDGQAQYWFSEETISLVERTIDTQGIDSSILCIGTPTLFEHFKRRGRKVFLLDFDDRLSIFYSATEFARFSMLVCHFYVPESRQHLLEFFRYAAKLICVCDPPFGVHVSALVRTIHKLKEYFAQAQPDNQENTFKTILFLPYFAGKHLVNSQLSMVDYRVTYSNHREYSKASKSIVRMFSDLPGSSFMLPSEQGYHFCDQCDRHVDNMNRHCWKCNACTSKDGTPFKHCDRCKRCVRKKYKHCKNCAFCHLNGHCPAHLRQKE